MTRGVQVLNEMWEKLKDERNDVVNEETFFWLCEALRALERGNVLDKIRAEIKQEITYKPIDMWDYRVGLAKALDIIDKNKAESEGEK